MTTKRKRVERQRAANPPPAFGMITPPEIVESLRLRRTIGDDEEFGRCSHALQLLPNGAILLLVTEQNDEGDVNVSTILMGEETPGFTAQKSKIVVPDEPSSE